ncbi:MAG: N-terminal beta barrel domain, partial [Solirubrobacteraceae bacterium]|nr:N-terminal beta barrel domain [Solirubrobacteraceae bacterium]
MPVTVTALAIAPVKGMRLMAARDLELGPAGAVGDRAFVIVEDRDHRLVATARAPDLVQVAPRWVREGGVLTLVFPCGEEVAAA